MADFSQNSCQKSTFITDANMCCSLFEGFYGPPASSLTPKLGALLLSAPPNITMLTKSYLFKVSTLFFTHTIICSTDKVSLIWCPHLPMSCSATGRDKKFVPSHRNIIYPMESGADRYFSLLSFEYRSTSWWERREVRARDEGQGIPAAVKPT